MIVGQTYSSVNGGHTRTFTFTQSASSTIGVATSATGQFGTFKQSGSVSSSSTFTITFATYSDAVARAMKTQYRFGSYRCSYPSTPGINTWVVYPTAFIGGATVLTVTNPTNATYCSTYAAGTKAAKDSGHVVERSYGWRSSRYRPELQERLLEDREDRLYIQHHASALQRRGLSTGSEGLYDPCEVRLSDA